MTAYRETQMMTEWGYELMFRCPECGALVDDEGLHSKFHAMLADNARLKSELSKANAMEESLLATGESLAEGK